MQIGEILEGVGIIETEIDLANLDIPNIANDNRSAEKGALFFAYKGTDYDSHLNVSELYAKKMIPCAVTERRIEGAPCIVVEDGRRAFALACANYFLNPAKKMSMIGVTGTNGKTTVTCILEKIFNSAGVKSVRIGTIGANVVGKACDLENTTPSPYVFYKILSEGQKAGATVAIAEVSSHALDQGRVAGVVFDAAVFTNLSGDHLDYHKDMETYYQAKKLLFSGNYSRMQIVNADNPYGVRIYADSEGKRFSYGRKGEFLTVSEYNVDASGTVATVLYNGRGYRFESRLVGEHNLENILAAASTALALGIEMSDVQKGIAELENVSGRLEKYSAGGVIVFVDYAHTDDALRNTMSALKKVTTGRLITVFGAGGDRDKSKRPRMGRAAQELSDIVIITSDNSRTEDPERIIDDILAGVTDCQKIYTEIDREKAIALAVRQANKGDVVLVAGKGHEKYQIISNTRYPFDDARFVKLYLKEKTGKDCKDA